MWTAPPAGYEVSGVLDVMMRVATGSSDSMTDVNIKDPAPNPTAIKNNQTLLVGFSGALKSGDIVTSRLYPVNAPDKVQDHQWTVSGRYGQRWVYWKKYTFTSYTGPVLLTFFVNGSAKALRGFMVNAP